MSGTWHHGKPGPPKRSSRKKKRHPRPWQEREPVPIERLEREIVGKKPSRARRRRKPR